uniref:Tc1-like transposase DDE domain-containing protein n=1 Tax=Maylandia zebra TaxID=106582 RepID=A0A3P9CRE6_9CICH
MRINVTLMVLMVSNITGMTSRSHHSGGGTIMVWGVVQGRQTAAGYVQMLQRALLMTEGPRLCGNHWVFQQDNATVPNAHWTRDFFQENNITLLHHPACSPDLNPTENNDNPRCSGDAH